MNALVTGGTGFIGSHLVDTLLKQGHTVTCLVRNTTKTAWLTGKPVVFVKGTLEDKDALMRAVSGADVVFHVAGLTAARSRGDFWRGNVEGTKHLLDAATTVPGLKRFVHVSSLAAVGPATEGHPVDERTPYHPITTYGESKRAAEDLVFSYSRRLPIAIVRPPAVYGPRDAGVYTYFQTLSKGIMPLIGFSDKMVSLVHVQDVVNGAILAATEEGAVGEAFFISSEKFYSWREIGGVTKRVMNKRAVSVRVPHSVVWAVSSISQFLGRFQAKPPIFDREKGQDIVQRYWTCDVKKAKEILHYRESIDLADGIKETVEWYRSTGWL